MNSRITHEGVLSAARDIQERMERMTAYTVVSSSASITSSSSTYSSVTASTTTSVSRSSSLTNEKGSHYFLNFHFNFSFHFFYCLVIMRWDSPSFALPPIPLLPCLSHHSLSFFLYDPTQPLLSTSTSTSTPTLLELFLFSFLFHSFVLTYSLSSSAIHP